MSSILRLAFLASLLSACGDDPVNNTTDSGIDASVTDVPAVDDSTPPGADVMDAVAQRSDAGVVDGD